MLVVFHRILLTHALVVSDLQCLPGLFEFTGVGSLSLNPSTSGLFISRVALVFIMCVPSYCASKKRQFRPKLLFHTCSRIGSPRRAAPRIHAHLHDERCTPGRALGIGISRCAQQWRARRSVGRILAQLLTASCVIAPLLSLRKKDQHGEHEILHPQRISRESRQKKLLSGSSDTGKGVKLTLNGQPAHKTRNTPSAPSRLPGRSRARELKVAQKYYETRFLDTD